MTSPKWILYHQKNCSIMSYPIKVEENWLFRYAVPVWNNNKQNWCSTADGPVLTPIKNASSAVRGVHLKWVQPCKRVPNCENSWNLAFSQRPACGRIVYRVCGYMAEMKQESSRRPSHVGTLEELQNYINQYEAHEGIQMEPGKIVKNAAKRSLAKLMMNSLWGKFGE